MHRYVTSTQRFT